MKKKLGKVIALLCLISGASLVLYPFLSQKIYDRKTGELIGDFEERKEEPMEGPELNSKLQELYEKLRQENERLYQDGQVGLKDPFSYEQPGIDLREYGLEENMIGYLQIDRMGIELPIYLGANDENMSLGAAHLTQTSYPIGGNNTNTVIAAHRGYSKAAMFREIEALQIGDPVMIHNFRETLTYRVTETKVVKPDDIQEILIRPDKDMVTLTTCHPYRHNYQRYLVFCERVPEEREGSQ